MAFGSFNEGGGGQPMAEINTTPLVDVMLVLLVIFIITAPIFHQAVPIDLPQVASTKIDEKPEVIQLAVDAEGGLFWNGEAISRTVLDERFAAAAGKQPELHLRADRKVPYEKVADVMAAAQRAQIVKIAFVTQPAQ
ncbi:biopolymer transporter ExbD [Dechloromonas sp. ZS-1]|jgi:biopolymer transport protein ExbD|uniref:ExbD/TolR family protein n=1 Tax=Dechloromonas sp. ZS-1 TaxID=3138067 RepID=UPI0031FDFF04